MPGATVEIWLFWCSWTSSPYHHFTTQQNLHFSVLLLKASRLLLVFKESFSLQTMPYAALLSVVWNIKSCIKESQTSLYSKYKLCLMFYYHKKVLDMGTIWSMTVYRVSSILLNMLLNYCAPYLQLSTDHNFLFFHFSVTYLFPDALPPATVIISCCKR